MTIAFVVMSWSFQLRLHSESQFRVNYDEKIRRLEDDLAQARWTVIDLLPEAIGKRLTSYYSCESRHETYDWEQLIIGEIIALAKPLSPEDDLHRPVRALCPLCGSTSRDHYQSGFTISEGLYRHLRGWGNVGQCAVMAVAMGLARDHWNRQFRAAEEAEAIQRRKRKKGEMLYRTAPDVEPKLIDEGLRVGKGRNAETLAWAEGRLAELGFKVTVEGNVKTYVDEREHLVVFADPRGEGEISFLVFSKPLPRHLRSVGIRQGMLGSFSLMDDWKHDIREKYERRLAAVQQR